MENTPWLHSLCGQDEPILGCGCLKRTCALLLVCVPVDVRAVLVGDPGTEYFHVPANFPRSHSADCQERCTDGFRLNKDWSTSLGPAGDKWPRPHGPLAGSGSPRKPCTPSPCPPPASRALARGQRFRCFQPGRSPGQPWLHPAGL